MLLLIGGHIRSGTTLLWSICNSHPDIKLTYEFNNLSKLGKTNRVNTRKILNRLWLKGILSNNFLDPTNAKEPWRQAVNVLKGHAFVASYILKIYKSGKFIDVESIEAVLHNIFPRARIVGDKYPHYVFLLDDLVKKSGLSCLIIYRDCRDVVSSTLQNVRSKWRSQKWIKDYNSAEKVAIRWVKAIESMERHKDKIHTVRYEDLVKFPIEELDKIAKWLGVDSSSFSNRLILRIKNTGIGKFKTVLTNEELKKVMEIAGPAMSRVGYI